MSRPEDLELLRALLGDYGDSLTDPQREKFLDMQMALMKDSRRSLTDKQRQFAKQVLDLHQPQYLNLVSSGKVPRGAEVPVPPALQNLPKRPPGRPAPAVDVKPYVPRYLDEDGNIREGCFIP